MLTGTIYQIFKNIYVMPDARLMAIHMGMYTIIPYNALAHVTRCRMRLQQTEPVRAGVNSCSRLDTNHTVPVGPAYICICAKMNKQEVCKKGYT